MRIAIATAVYYPQVNGVAVFAHNLAQGLAQRGHEVLVLCPSLDGAEKVTTEDGVLVARLRSVEVKMYPDQVHAVPPRKKLFGVKLPKVFYRHGFKVSVFPQREIAAILDEFQPEVVHVQVSDPIGLSCVSYARKHAVPVVTTEHNQPEVITDPLKVPGVLKKPANALLAAYFVNRQSKSDFVTMPTEKAIRELIPDDFSVPVEAVSNGVDLAKFKPGRAPRELYEKYGISADLPTVLYVGRLDPEKNVGAVIEAYKVASARMKSGVAGGKAGARVKNAAQLVIVGDGVDRARLTSLAAGREDIHFLGRVVGEDLHEIYKVGWVFATASEIETQGIVLIEAAACGLPLIAVDAGAVSEVCRDGENGVLCRPKDVGGIAQAMYEILTDAKLRRKFGKASVAIAQEHDFEKTLDKFIEIYRRVMEK